MRQGSRAKWYILGFAASALAAFAVASFYYRAPIEQDAPSKEPADAFVSGGVSQDDIPSIDEPAFERVAIADQYLKNEGFGLDVVSGREHRFYPYQILVWHQIVNDDFNGMPLLVTFDPLGGLGIVYDREVNGEPLSFGVSGKLWNNNLVMYDRNTKSEWIQATGVAATGSFSGAALVRSSSHVMTWQAWKSAYPGGLVLSRDTGADRDYTRDPYGNYDTNDTIWFPLQIEDPRLQLKDAIYGLSVNGAFKAYPASIVETQNRIDDSLGGQQIAIVNDEDSGLIVAYRVQEDKLGADLPLDREFWFLWSNIHPDTDVYLP